MLQRLFILCPGSSNPPLHHIIPTPVLCPSSLASPAAAMACICRHTSKDKFFFPSFFRFFSDQCYRDPLYPTRWVLKPPPLHHIIPTTVPRLSSLASPHHRLCLTTCKSAATATPSLRARSTHDADSPHASPTVTPSQHGTQGPPRRQPAMHKPRRGATSTRNARPQHRQPVAHKPRHGATPTRNTRPRHRQPPAMPTQRAGPHHHAATPTRRTGPRHHAIPNTVCKMEQQWGWWRWWTVGWWRREWQRRRGTPTYLRLYIF